MSRKSRKKIASTGTPPTPPKPPAGKTTPPWIGADWGIILGLAALTAAVFAQVRTHEFLNWDDRGIFLNAIIRRFDVRAAFTSEGLGMPLTWLSYMIDYRLFGMKAAAILITNVVLHAAGACLLFAALRTMTAARWPSAFVAALFAIHPMHVQPVAWISDRKDVLSTALVMLAIFFYAKRRMILTAVAMALSLMSKGTYVTLPFVLLLLDYWPLRRLRRVRDLRPLLLEKLPLFALSIAGSFMAVVGQQALGTIRSQATVPLDGRIANALFAYEQYLVKLFVPRDLAALYPWVSIKTATAVLCALLLIAVTAAVLLLRRRTPYLLVGWLWFVGTLVPLIGIVQIGAEARADRFTYFAYVGLFLAIAWGLSALPAPRVALAAGAAGVVAVFSVAAWRQVQLWQNCDTLFSQTIAVTPPNPLAEFLLGQYLQLTDPPRALAHLRRAIELGRRVYNPSNHSMGWYVDSHVAAGTALFVEARSMPAGPARTAKLQESIDYNRQALQFSPDSQQSKQVMDLAQGLLGQDKPKVDDYLNAGTALANDGKVNEAVVQYQRAVDAAPQSAEARVYLALGLLRAQRIDEAAAALRQAKSIDAVKANAIVTAALQREPNPDNLDLLLAQIQTLRRSGRNMQSP